MLLITLFDFIGEGGCGKSYLISAISKWTEKILGTESEPYSDLPYKPRVLLLAATGSASSLIGKYDIFRSN